MKYKFMVEGEEFENLKEAYRYQKELSIREKLGELFEYDESWESWEIVDYLCEEIDEINKIFNAEVQVAVVEVKDEV